MNEQPPEAIDEARRWLGEASEELDVADVLAAETKLPARAACFHAHLAAEKALKGLLIARDVVSSTTTISPTSEACSTRLTLFDSMLKTWRR